MIVDSSTGTEYPTAIALAERYAHTPDRPVRWWLRANMISSLDGGGALDGTSSALGGDGDRLVFSALRGVCDAVLVASSTVRAERYGPLRPDPDFTAWRRIRHQANAPILAIVSGSLSMDPAAEVLRAPGTLVLTRRSAPATRRQELQSRGVTLVDCGDGEVNLSVALDHLAAAGLWRVLCEGGPTLLGELVDTDLVDEMCLTVAPLLLSGDAGRVARGDGPLSPTRMTRQHVLTDEAGYLFTRWERRR